MIHLPAMEILAAGGCEKTLRSVIGLIIWDGQTFPNDVDATLGAVFTDPFDMLFIHVSMGLWEYDENILRAHGMEYCALLIEVDETSTKVQRLIYHDGELALRPFNPASFYSVPDFVNKNAKYAQRLLDWFTHYVYVIRT